MAAGGNEPCSWVVGDTGARPGFERGGDGVLGGFFGEVEAAQQADKRGQDAGPVVAPDLFVGFVEDGIVEMHEPIVAQPPKGRRGEWRWAHGRQKKL